MEGEIAKGVSGLLSPVMFALVGLGTDEGARFLVKREFDRTFGLFSSGSANGEPGIEVEVSESRVEWDAPAVAPEYPPWG
jgi:hypothetical protein